MSFVKKLDDKAEFDGIKTGITITSLKKHEQQVYNVWFNHFWTRKELVPRGTCEYSSRLCGLIGLR